MATVGIEIAMNNVHRSIIFSAAERYGSFSVFLFSTAILSRLLNPGEFGLSITINALIALVGASFQEFGGSNYLIQKRELSCDDIRTAFTMTLCISTVLAAALFWFSGAVAAFYAQDGLKQGISIAALNFLLLPFSVTIGTLLRRDMDFASVTRCSFASNFVTAAASVALAMSGYGFMSPILGAFLGHIVLVGLYISCRPDLRIFLPRLRGGKDVINFGAYSGATALINVFYELLPQLVLGRVLNFTAVGLYGRAVTVTQKFDRLVLDVLYSVITPAIFAQTRAGGDLKRIYLRAIELSTALQWPFLIVLMITAEPVIRIWLGAGWLEIVPLVRLLCLASLSLFAASLTYPVLVAVGRVRDTLVSSLISLPPSLVVIFIASFFGLQAVAASALLTLPFQAAVALFFVSRHLSISGGDLVRATVKSGIVAACTGVGAALGMATNSLTIGIPAVGLFVAGLAGLGGWWLGLTMTKHPLLGELHAAARGALSIARRLAPVRQGAIRLQTEIVAGKKRIERSST